MRNLNLFQAPSFLKRLRYGLLVLCWAQAWIGGSISLPAHGAEATVYQVYRAIDLGETEVAPPRDIFVSMGTGQGLKKGTLLDVYRRISSFDNLTQKHMGDHMIPVGRLRVIHSDEATAIARLENLVSIEKEPALLPQAVMIGDVVRVAK